MNSNFEDIVEMHKKYGFDHGGPPRFLSEDDMEFRSGFLAEELREFIEAHNERDLDGAADALIDLVVVAMGTAVMMGLPWQMLWNDVHRANMSKVRGVTDRGVDNDLQKPPGWVPPQTTSIIDSASYRNGS